MRAAVVGIAVTLLAASAASARTIEGTPRGDRLTGTPRADSLFGREGADRLIAREGSDFVHGGPGRDVIDAGPGNDRVATQYDGARDRVVCGPGVDVVTADPLDAVAPDCEVVSRRISRDPYTDPDGQHETQVEPDSLTVGRTTVATFQVGRRFDGGATNIGYAVSTDDGRTWRQGLLPGLTRASRPAGTHIRASDPVVAFDAEHGVWLIGTLAIEGPTTRLTVSRSRDGFTWESPVVAIEATATGGITFDKNWLVCDNGASSPHRGRCYLPYTDALRADRIAVLTSADGGLTWSAPVGIPVTDSVGAFPVVRPSGDVVVIFLWDGRRIGSSVSTDGGSTFGPVATVADVRARTIRGHRFFPLPSADVDPSTGTVRATWHDCRHSPGCETNSVVVSSSADGRGWSAPVRVTTGRNAVLPAIGIHPTNGRLAFLYYVVRANGGIDAELVESRPGGANAGFLPPRRLSAQTMSMDWIPSTSSGRMLADYVSVHYAAGRPLAVWALASEPAGGKFKQAIFATRG